MATPKSLQVLLRNVGIIAHIDAGKTTLSERILFYTHKIHRLGEVHEGTAAMDYLPEEQERGITIVSACTSVEWCGHTINLIDTPGHVDFTIEVERSLRVLDGAVGVFCAVGGVEPQSETVWRQSEKFGIPKLAFINKMDRLGADFAGVVDQLETVLHARPLPVQLPWGSEHELKGVIDVLAMETIVFDQDSRSEKMERIALDEDARAFAEPWRERLIESLAEGDESLLDAYLEGSPIDASWLQDLLRAGTLARRFTPVFAGSALKNIGVQPLLDAVVAYLPSPAEAAPAEGHHPETGLPVRCQPSPDAPLAGLVFKIIMESGRKLALVRLYSGTLAEGAQFYNATQHKTERAQRLYHLHADQREHSAQALAGDIVGIGGLKFAKTGDTLCTKDAPVVLEAIDAYQPVIAMAIEPKNADEGHKLEEALEKYLAEDPTLRVELDEDTGQRVVSGMGELHLSVLLERMQREYHIAPRAGSPQVVFMETVSSAGKAQAVVDRDLGELHHHGEVALSVAPLARGEGAVVSFDLDTEDWPKPLLDAVSQGLEDGLQSGVLQGYPIRDVQVRVEDLGDKARSSAPGLHMAAVAALREALKRASPRILEPIMRLEIAVPEQYVGEAVGLLSARGGRVEEIGEKSGQHLVQGVAPMGKLFGFATALRSATQGRAGVSMQFDRFDTLD